MISDPPIHAADNVAQVLQKVRAYVASAQAMAADGLTVGEFAELATGLVRVASAAVESMPLDGPSKKEWVLEAVGLLFDAVADRMIPVLAYPVWVIVRPAVRSLTLAVAGGAVEAILPMLRRPS